MYNRLWHEWAYSFGACIVPVLLACAVSLFVMPAIVLVIAWALNILAEAERSKHGSHCLLIMKQTSEALTISVVIMILCIFVHSRIVDDLPFVTTTIIFTTMAVKLLIFIFTHNFNNFCRDCKVRNGLSPHDAFVGNMLHNESKYQLKIAIILSTVISIICWLYFIFECHGSSFPTKSIDAIVGISVLLYVISLIYVACAYTYTVHFMQKANINNCNNNITTLRYLVLRGDSLLVADIPNKFSPETTAIDTPASVNIAYTRDVPDNIAIERFEALSNCTGFRLRTLYNNCSFAENANVFHYAIIVDDNKPLPDNWALGDGWVSLDRINRAWRFGELSPALAAEIHRIFTITMAWKTYDRNGNRLYPIKNYYPTFRLRDFKNWDVDYGDMHWIYVSENNQDKPMFKVRKFIHKITTLHVR